MDLSDDAAFTALSFFALGPKSRLSFGGDDAVMRPTAELASALAELEAAGLITSRKDPTDNRTHMQGGDFDHRAVAAILGSESKPFDAFAAFQRFSHLRFESKG